MAAPAQREVPLDLLPRLRIARDHVDAHFAEALDLDRLAAVAGVSKYHFARTFEAAYGEPPMRYLTRRRIERAQDLLRSVNLTVTEVCHLVGFTSLGSFSSRFRELTGRSPSEFQRAAHRDARPPVPGCYVLMWGRPQPGHPKTATTEKPEPVTAG
jgi:AraC-like DNA-binding protein